MAAATARQFGFAGFPLVTVEQPFDRLAPTRVEEIAAEIAADVIHCLTAPAVDLQEEFTGAWLLDEAALTVDACVIRPSLPG
jgi:hypothetical protein